jgi:hypothetical protein
MRMRTRICNAQTPSLRVRLFGRRCSIISKRELASGKPDRGSDGLNGDVGRSAAPLTSDLRLLSEPASSS